MLIHGPYTETIINMSSDSHPVVCTGDLCCVHHKPRGHRWYILVKYLYFIPCNRSTLVFNSPFYTSRNNSTLFTLTLLNTSRQHSSNGQTQFRIAQSWVFSQWQVIEELLMLKWSFGRIKYLKFDSNPLWERWQFQTSYCKWPMPFVVL